MTGGSFGLALLTPTNAQDSSRYYGIQASASNVELLGISFLQLTVSQLNVTVNGSTGTSVANQVVNFAATNWTGGATPAGYLAVATGPTTSVQLSASQQLIEASGNLSVNILSGLVKLSGSVDIELTQETVTLSDGTTVPVDALVVGVANGSATIAPTSSESATISGVTLGLAYFTPESSADGRSWLGLQTEGGTVTAGTGGIQANVSNFAVNLNQGYGSLNGASNTTAVNFSTSFNGALIVATGGVNSSGTPITVSLGFTQAILSLSAELQVNIDNYFYAQGTFSYTSLPGNQTITLANGQTASVSVTELAVTNATVFAGTVGDGGFYANTDGTLDPTDVGFVLTNANFVVVKMTLGSNTWTAVLATASSASLVGLSGFSLSVNSVSVQVNTFGSSNATPNNSAVNFATSYSSTNGLQLATGATTPLTINYTSDVVQVVANATMTIGNFVFISGTVDFQSGATGTASD